MSCVPLPWCCVLACVADGLLRSGPGICGNAGDWLALTAGWAAALGVPHVITANGALKRAPYQDRIQFLASVRNKLLDPLLVQDTATGFWRGEMLDMSDTNGTADGARGMQQRSVTVQIVGQHVSMQAWHAPHYHACIVA